MASLNRVFLIGNLTKDPELRYIPSGQAVATMRIASTEKFRTKAGEDKEETLFIDVVVWARQAETVSQYLKKGSPVFVEGKLQIKEFAGREGGKQYKTQITANRVQFLSRGPGAPGGAAPGGESRSGGGYSGGDAPAPDAVEEPLPSFEEEGT